jgi:hypothetical protein
LDWHSPLDVGEAAGLAAVDALGGLLVAAEAEFGVHCVVSVVVLVVVARFGVRFVEVTDVKRGSFRKNRDYKRGVNGESVYGEKESRQ